MCDFNCCLFLSGPITVHQPKFWGYLVAESYHHGTDLSFSVLGNG